MNDRQISFGCVAAYGLWSLSVALWGVSVFVDKRPIVSLAILVAMAASTATVRSYMVSQHRRLRALSVPDMSATVRTLH